ncbi:RsmE family RNA methyltransferase [Rickettsiales endosymbiont of Stachyamoeba lipophora]|uniref:RsmE family RNA methyltransferase n=1 Tax=Rickettsiales endosymbiont of Stachyamoeba lipophora TaxID=2486578 RepID=UPI000F64D9D5|nr:RsmE family RNA methyltransferase [Rickettsiales endosymbiont of Stachyamoeba lipophora]AZL15528.1 16S rRNA (uracil(1498)-N(3))-methyltransferase [Rickettsiales endosymbiont of Stachyamoeba lipophora]
MTKFVPRIYYPNPILPTQEMILVDELFHYLASVLKAKVGTSLKIFNADDGEFEAVVVAKENKKIIIRVSNKIAKVMRSTPSIRLCFSPIKPHRMHDLIEKGTELGITEFQPIIMQHSIVREFNVSKYNKVAIEATEQSERFTVPIFKPQLSFEDFIEIYQEEQILWANENEENVQNIFPKASFRCYNMLIGPEGGFSGQEKEILTRLPNVQSVSLGKFILRAETAAFSLISWINFINLDDTPANQ